MLSKKGWKKSAYLIKFFLKSAYYVDINYNILSLAVTSLEAFRVVRGKVHSSNFQFKF
jgi:hypothetical protein